MTMITKKDIVDAMSEALKPFIEITKNLTGTIEVLADAALAEQLYDDKERFRLLAEYRQLRAADVGLYEEIVRSHDQRPEPKMVFEERVEKYGKEIADQHVEPVSRAMAARQCNSKKIAEWEKEHPVIARLYWAGTKKKER